MQSSERKTLGLSVLVGALIACSGPATTDWGTHDAGPTMNPVVDATYEGSGWMLPGSGDDGSGGSGSSGGSGGSAGSSSGGGTCAPCKIDSDCQATCGSPPQAGDVWCCTAMACNTRPTACPSGSGSGSGSSSGGGSGSSSGRGGSGANGKCVSNVLKPTGAVASSENAATSPASFAVDGNFNTRWESAFRVDPQWIYVDFGAPVFINRVQIGWEAACATKYDLQTSDDKATWTTMKSITGNTSGGPAAPADWSTAADHQGFSGTGRYFRVNGKARCLSPYGYSIWEMQVFGDTNASCLP